MAINKLEVQTMQGITERAPTPTDAGLCPAKCTGENAG